MNIILPSKRSMAGLLVFVFLANFWTLPYSHGSTDLPLPAPGQMVSLSPSFSPAVLKGIQLDPDNPFQFHFYVDKSDGKDFTDSQLRRESSRLIKYFLASLTIPEKDLWVNLSPYEKDRIVPKEFGQTEMGRDLLAQDYLLKQVTASLIYPESPLGKEFWQKVYAQAQAKYGTTNIPINTFNKVWIVPEKAVVYENGGTAFVLENRLKVMLEEDYLALAKHECRGEPCVRPQPMDVNLGRTQGSPLRKTNQIGSQIVREIVIPALTKEVNEGQNFAQLRQVFYSLILATWYKKKIKDSILTKVLADQNKIEGIGIHNVGRLITAPTVLDVQTIYNQYLQAFKKGVHNYIKEEPDPRSNQTIPRKYFSGGVNALQVSQAITVIGPNEINKVQLKAIASTELMDILGDFAMTQKNEEQSQNRGNILQARMIDTEDPKVKKIVRIDGNEELVIITYDEVNQIREAKYLKDCPSYPAYVSVSGQIFIRDYTNALIIASMNTNNDPVVSWFNEGGHRYRSEVIDSQWLADRHNIFAFKTDYALIPIFKFLWNEHPLAQQTLERLVFIQTGSYTTSANGSTKHERLKYTEAAILKRLANRQNIIIGDVGASTGITSLDLVRAFKETEVTVVSSDANTRVDIVTLPGAYAEVLFHNSGWFINKIYTEEKGFAITGTEVKEHPLNPQFKEKYAKGKYTTIFITSPEVDAYAAAYPDRLILESKDGFYPSLNRRFDLIRMANLLRWTGEEEIDLLRAQGNTLKEGGFLLLARDEYGVMSQEYSIWKRIGMGLVYEGGTYLARTLPHEIPLSGPIVKDGKLVGWVSAHGDYISVTYGREPGVSVQMADGTTVLNPEDIAPFITAQDIPPMDLYDMPDRGKDIKNYLIQIAKGDAAMRSRPADQAMSSGPISSFMDFINTEFRSTLKGTSDQTLIGALNLYYLILHQQIQAVSDFPRAYRHLYNSYLKHVTKEKMIPALSQANMPIVQRPFQSLQEVKDAVDNDKEITIDFLADPGQWKGRSVYNFILSVMNDGQLHMSFYNGYGLTHRFDADQDTERMLRTMGIIGTQGLIILMKSSLKDITIPGVGSLLSLGGHSHPKGTDVIPSGNVRENDIGIFTSQIMSLPGKFPLDDRVPSLEDPITTPVVTDATNPIHKRFLSRVRKVISRLTDRDHAMGTIIPSEPEDSAMSAVLKTHGFSEERERIVWRRNENKAGEKWLMTFFRDIEIKPIALTIKEMPIVKMGALSLLSNNSRHKIYLSTAMIEENKQPILVKQAVNNDEFINAQILDRLGIGPRFYGLVKNSRDEIMGYAMQFVPGDSLKTERLDNFSHPDLQEMIERLEDIGINLPQEFFKTETGGYIAIDAEELQLKPSEQAIDRYNAFIRKCNDSAMKANLKIPGGIDLNPAQMNVEVKKGVADFKFNFNGQIIDASQVTGAEFTIRQMTPVTNLLFILGLKEGLDKSSEVRS